MFNILPCFAKHYNIIMGLLKTYTQQIRPNTSKLTHETPKENMLCIFSTDDMYARGQSHPNGNVV